MFHEWLGFNVRVPHHLSGAPVTEEKDDFFVDIRHRSVIAPPKQRDRALVSLGRKPSVGQRVETESRRARVMTLAATVRSLFDWWYEARGTVRSLVCFRRCRMCQMTALMGQMTWDPLHPWWIISPSSTDLFLASALAMASFTPCSAILSQSYGKSIAQFWHIFAVFWDKLHLKNAILLRHDPISMADIN
jgi:hypothetical protein